MEDEVDEAPETTTAGLTTQPIDPLQVLEVSPSEFRIQCQLNTEVSYTFTLRSIVDRCVAFKVKTTAPRRYMVRPAQGTISSGEAVPITIVLVKMSQYPDQSNPRNTRDKFLVQSFALERELSADDLNSLWVTKEKEHNPRANCRAYYEHRLKCRLLVPSEEPPVPPSAPVSATSPSARSPMTEPAESGLGVVVSPPLDDAAIELSSQSTKAPSDPSPPSVAAPAEGVLSPAEPLSAAPAPVPAQKEAKSSAPEPQPNTTPSAQPGASNNQEKDTLPSRKRSDAPLLANHPKEYEKMLAYSVKLTVEREALENKLAKISEHNSFLLLENEQLRKALAVEQGISVAASTTSSSVNEPKQRSALDALQTGDGRYRPLLEPDFDFSESHANLVASQLALNSGIQLWQVLAVAALCFLIGRIL